MSEDVKLGLLRNLFLCLVCVEVTEKEIKVHLHKYFQEEKGLWRKKPWQMEEASSLFFYNMSS